jgi:hypothetical protein
MHNASTIKPQDIAQRLIEIMRKVFAGPDYENPLIVEGITAKFGFNREVLESYREDVITIMREMPPVFFEGVGGGQSFLNLCVTRENRPWGEHRDMERLMVLGMGLDLIECVFARPMWGLLPGNMPYLSFKIEPVAVERSTGFGSLEMPA